jgi:hypothetical protein
MITPAMPTLPRSVRGLYGPVMETTGSSQVTRIGGTRSSPPAYPHMEWARQMAFVKHFYFYLCPSLGSNSARPGARTRP